MQKSTLVVDDDEGRRRALVHAFSRRGMRYLDVADAFAAMAALGRADFGAVVAAEGRRTLSLRGLCQLARRRHPGVHIVVLHRDGTDPTQIPQVLGTQVDCMAGASAPEDVARLVEEKLIGPPLEDTAFEIDVMPDTSEALAVFDDEPTQKLPIAALSPDPNSLSPHEATERMPAAPSVTPDSASGLEPRDTLKLAHPATSALLEGLLDGNAGPALLMGVFAAELTGRLIIKDGPAAGTLYFYRGEPVWADDPLGDQGLHRRLVQKGKLPPDAKIASVPQGYLLGSLVQNGTLSGQGMHDFMREVVRDCVLALATAESGAYRFEEDKKFLEVAPLLKVNPFGLILESRRKSITPAQLLTISGEFAPLFAIPGPGLATAQEKLAPFVRGARLEEIIDGTKNVERILADAQLDPFMGTLVLLSLRDARLVTLEMTARSQDGGVTLGGPFFEPSAEEITLVDAEAPRPPASADEAKAREEIYALYMRLKPLTLPRQVLGVAVDAELEEVEAAYQRRMAELDPGRIPEGSARQMLASRVEELRKKVTSAYEALRLQFASGPISLAALQVPPKTDPY
jgi:hypothetical protein